MADQGFGNQDPWAAGQAPAGPPPTLPYVAPPPPPPGAGYGQPPGYPPGYGYQQPVVYVDAPKSKLAAALLAFFLGAFGIHNFYLGRTGLGLTQLLLATVGGVFTCGMTTLAVGVWAFVEFILILCGNIRDSHGRALV
jgi:TM2 domain-containing membrane protein YozV